MAVAVAKKLLSQSPLAIVPKSLPIFSYIPSTLCVSHISTTVAASALTTCTSGRSKKKKVKQKNRAAASAAEVAVKKRTRSDREFDEESFLRHGDSGAAHIPVMLGEVLEVFASLPIRSFIDCTLGAAGHSSAIIQAHPEMQLYIGLDVDPIAHEQAQSRINAVVRGDPCDSSSGLKAHVFLKNFRDIEFVLPEVDEKLLIYGVDGILMDLGMSSMQVNNAERGFSVLCDGPLDMRMNPQASLKAEDILNSWPDVEVGRILREYGEESNWYSLQNKIVRARQKGGLHSTGELVDLIRSATSWTKGGRQGWIKTATRVFQALRIAVNDELNVLKDSLYACFKFLAPGGRLAVISFHSLEDRIVKQTFLDLISQGISEVGNQDEEKKITASLIKTNNDDGDKETWIKRTIHGLNGTILTKRPITPSLEEERLNRRSRSAKLRVIQKA
ncbi:16S rRNA (cytosine(1402)-N(4))-methyltransferase [Bertholletia excelsa]